MTERPIIFSGPMVRAIIEGRKTQTRRAVKPDPWWSVAPLEFTNAPGTWAPNDAEDARKCPYGGTGDRLWVRETWADGQAGTGCPDDAGTTLYRATDPGWDDNDTGLRWLSPIYMTRDRSRLTLEVVGVRVQRVQEISERDAEDEGFQSIRCQSCGYTRADCHTHMDHRICGAPYPNAIPPFREAWDRLNAKRGHQWDANPWVWAIKFRRIDQ